MNASNPVVEALTKLLADSYTLYLKTQNFHWNVTGPQFFELHNTFETHYRELAEAVDEIAERIRALEAFAPGSYTAFRKVATIEECTELLSAEQMVSALTADLQEVASTARKLMIAASEAGDEVTMDLAVQRAAIHDKQAWMLRSMQSRG